MDIIMIQLGIILSHNGDIEKNQLDSTYNPIDYFKC